MKAFIDKIKTWSSAPVIVTHFYIAFITLSLAALWLAKALENI